MAHEFKVVRRVEFSETDMAGIVHYSNFFRLHGNCGARFFSVARIFHRDAECGTASGLAESACAL